MRAKIDENRTIEAVRLLVEAGWEASTVHDERFGDAADQLVIAECPKEDRVLFSLDLDFGDIRRYPPEECSGIVVLRPVEPDRETVLALLATALPAFAHEPIRQRLWIVDPNRIRVRGANEAL
jgi:predicted nuclease of predicted toxin-antitoxin system